MGKIVLFSTLSIKIIFYKGNHSMLIQVLAFLMIQFKAFVIPLQKKFNFGMAKNGPRLRYPALVLGINSTNHFFSP